MEDIKAVSAECIRYVHRREHSWAQGFNDALINIPIPSADMNNASYLSGRISGLANLSEKRRQENESRLNPQIIEPDCH